MLKFFNGGSSLALTYWLGVFGVGTALKILNRAILTAYVRAVDPAVYNRLDFYINFILVFGTLYFLIMVRAMFKAGYNNRTPGGWGWVGIVLTVLTAGFTAFSAYTVLFPSATSPVGMLYIEVAQLNKVLPQEAGEGVILERAALKNDTLIYSLSADVALDPAIREFMSEPMLNDVEGQDACKEFSGYFKGGLKAIIYEYSFLDGVVEQRIDAAECQAWLDAQ